MTNILEVKNLKQFGKIKIELKDNEARKKFWLRNIKNFEKNLEILVPKKIGKYKVYLVCGEFSGKKIMPYDTGSFSSCNLLAASKKQGYEIMVFLNKARLGFLSSEALMPVILHEIKHIRQAVRNPKEYLISIIDDKISIRLEKEAEKIDDKLRKRYALESVLYCYDNYGWSGAEKMAKFLFNSDKLYGGGYKKTLSLKEYKAFLEARKKKNIDIFIEVYKRC